jgi:sphingolipid delta-4 desaturase
MQTAGHLCFQTFRRYCQVQFRSKNIISSTTLSRAFMNLMPISNSFLGKALWLLFFPIVQIFRLSRLKEIHPIDGWIVTNFVLQAAFTAAIWYFMGWPAVAFLLLSFSFSVGLHPLGARWIQEHYLTHSVEQETYSYYGSWNVL